MTSSKLLKIIFGVLLMVIIGEIGYISIQSLCNVKIPKKDIELALILLKDVKKKMSLAQKRILTKLNRIEVYESKIKKVELREGPKNIFKYNAVISLEYKPNENLDIYLNKIDLNKTKVFVENKGQLLPYNFSLLKKGDYVKIELITKELEYFDKNTEQITIIKINK